MRLFQSENISIFQSTTNHLQIKRRSYWRSRSRLGWAKRQKVFFYYQNSNISDSFVHYFYHCLCKYFLSYWVQQFLRCPALINLNHSLWNFLKTKRGTKASLTRVPKSGRYFLQLVKLQVFVILPGSWNNCCYIYYSYVSSSFSQTANEQVDLQIRQPRY